MSGSGKSVALNTLEDLDFYCVDNLPAELLPEFVRSVVAASRRRAGQLAVGIDVRNRHTICRTCPSGCPPSARSAYDPRLVFFDTGDEVLLKRYADTRRRHPLEPPRPGAGRRDRARAPGAAAACASARRRRHRHQPSSTCTSCAGGDHRLRHWPTTIRCRCCSSPSPTSVAYPPDADFVFDARCLPNPHWNPELRPLSGRDDAGARVPRYPGRRRRVRARRCRLPRCLAAALRARTRAATSPSRSAAPAAATARSTWPNAWPSTAASATGATSLSTTASSIDALPARRRALLSWRHVRRRSCSSPMKASARR